MINREKDRDRIIRVERECSELRDEALPEIRVLSAIEMKSITSDELLIASRVVGESGIQLSKDESKSVLGELEAFAPFLAGYVSQIENSGSLDVEIASNWLQRLKQYRILHIPHVNDWYMTADDSFKTLKRYMANLDYLRLVLIEHIDTYLTN